MKYRTYTRKEYLEWCKQNGVKNPLPEYTRNPFSECGYPIIRGYAPGEIIDDLDPDEWVKNRW